jgi:hypothetical protein
VHQFGFIYKKCLYPYIIASITKCQTGLLLCFWTMNKTNDITSSWDTGTNSISVIPDERNTLTTTKRHPLWISYILHELPCSEKNSWPNWSIHVSLELPLWSTGNEVSDGQACPLHMQNNRNWEFVDVMISWKIIGADVTNSLEWFLLEKPIIAQVMNPKVRDCVHWRPVVVCWHQVN